MRDKLANVKLSIFKGEKMKHCLILYGNMTHGEFSVSRDPEPMVIVHSIDERAYMDPADADEYMTANGYDGYLIPSEFKGVIVYSCHFLAQLGTMQ